MPKTTMSVEDATNSLTGPEEDAIFAAFGADITDLAQGRKPKYLRALIAVLESRETGEQMRVTHRNAMALPMGEVLAYFVSDEDEPMPDEPITEPGKDV